jgi:hypothetical protein
MVWNRRATKDRQSSSRRAWLLGAAAIAFVESSCAGSSPTSTAETRSQAHRDVPVELGKRYGRAGLSRGRDTAHNYAPLARLSLVTDVYVGD